METYTITLTAEECAELARTLMGRIDFDIKELQDEAAQEKNYKRIAYLQHIADVNKAVLNKIPTKAMKSIL